MRRLDATSLAWIFLVVVLSFWFVVLLRIDGEVALNYIMGSGVIFLGAWVVLFFAERTDTSRDHELQVSQQKIRELEANERRSNARIRELEAEVKQTPIIAAHWNQSQATMEQRR